MESPLFSVALNHTTLDDGGSGGYPLCKTARSINDDMNRKRRRNRPSDWLSSKTELSRMSRRVYILIRILAGILAVT
jgi:hypothetical protein